MTALVVHWDRVGLAVHCNSVEGGPLEPVPDLMFSVSIGLKRILV